MAVYTDTHHRAADMVERVTSALSHRLSGGAEILARRRIARTTYMELSSLSDRELIDLGLTRFDLRRVAREVAQGRL